MPEVSAAIGRAALISYRGALAVRREQARRYIELLQQFDGIAMHRKTTDAPWQVFPCLLPHAEAVEVFVAAAALQGLEVRRYYRPSLTDWGGIASHDDCPVARDLAQRMVCLPVYSNISDNEIEEIHGIVRGSLAKSLGQTA